MSPERRRPAVTSPRASTDAVPSDVLVLAEAVWRFLTVAEPPVPSDVIFVFGSQDLRIPDHAASLYGGGHAPSVLVTGAYGRMSRDLFDQPEGLVFKDRLVAAGVPDSAIITEVAARNTLQNVTHGVAALRRHGVAVGSALLVAKPFVMRRCAATFARHAPDIQVRCCPPTDDLGVAIDRAPLAFVRRLVAEIDRLDRYAAAGDIVAQPLPADVRAAARQLADQIPPS